MKILIDIGHPAHVHYFKNFIKKFSEMGNQIIVVSRKKEVTFDLLETYKIPFVSRGTGKSSLLGKFFYLFIGASKIWREARRNKIDIFLSFGSPYNAIASFFYRKPCITVDDTEHNANNHNIYYPNSDLILTPESFRKEMGEKQVRFKSIMELTYLSPKVFTPIDRSINTTKNVLFRFVGWNANHDVGQSGLTMEQKQRLVEFVGQYANIYISSEVEITGDLKKYQIKISPTEFHDFISGMDLYIGEGGTTANECACLGIPNILINSLLADDTIPGVHLLLEDYKLQYLFKEFNETIFILIKKALTSDYIHDEFRINRDVFLAAHIDFTEFLIEQINRRYEKI